MTNLWSMQLHPNNMAEFPTNRITDILNRRQLVGVGGDNRDSQRFQNDAQIGDIVLIRNGAEFIALVQLTSRAYENPNQDDDCWFDWVRDVKVIADSPQKYAARFKALCGNEPTEGLRVRGTFTRIWNDNVLQFINFWMNGEKGGAMTSEMIELLKSAKQIVFTGAPGTGKTYLARQMAHKMILGHIVDDEEDLTGAESDVLEEHLGFCQFHPSMDYTDFVEGLRPTEVDDETGQIGFSLKDGIFKAFCKKAVTGLIGQGDDKEWMENFNNAWQRLILEHINEAADEILRIPIGDNRSLDVEVNTRGTGLASRKYDESGHPIKGQNKFFSREQLYRVYRGQRGVPSGAHDGYRRHIIAFMKKECGLRNFVVSKQDNTARQKPYVFIIDEINRGDIAKVFGELFFAIDPEYRGEKKGRIKTQYDNLIQDDDVFKKGFFVPENVYIIATMNDIDRGVESMDFAIRRRFIWREIKPKDTQDAILGSAIRDISVRERARNRMDNLNKAITDDAQNLGAAFQIGAAYFAKLEENDFEKLWQYRLEPLLLEYMRGQEEVKTRLDRFHKAFQNESALSSVGEA